MKQMHFQLSKIAGQERSQGRTKTGRNSNQNIDVYKQGMNRGWKTDA